jgi:hypothetical protein
MKKLSLLIPLLCLAALVCSCESKSNEGDGGIVGDGGEVLRFVWLADSRGTSENDVVNTPVVNALVAQIGALNPKPAFVVFGGDMSFRGYNGSNFTFQAWKALFTPLANTGIPLYTTMGNHELFREHQSGFFLANQQQFQTDFSSNPSNGPAGYEHLTYSWSSPGGTIFFAVLDPYYLTADIDPSGLGGTIDPTQMTWLQNQVAQTKAIHKFLFIHTPYYYTNDDDDEPSAADATYTNLWAFLDTNLFDMYACGHSHLFARRTIDSTLTPNPQVSPAVQWKNNVVQLINGAAGAGPSTGTPKVDPIVWNIHQAANTYYYTVVDISGRQATVNSYAGNTGAYSVIDTFTIVKQ